MKQYYATGEDAFMFIARYMDVEGFRYDHVVYQTSFADSLYDAYLCALWADATVHFDRDMLLVLRWFFGYRGPKGHTAQQVYAGTSAGDLELATAIARKLDNNPGTPITQSRVLSAAFWYAKEKKRWRRFQRKQKVGALLSKFLFWRS